jgi:hypothetical protein
MEALIYGILGSVGTFAVIGSCYEMLRMIHNERLMSALIALLETDTAITHPKIQELIIQIKNLIHVPPIRQYAKPLGEKAE